MIKIIQNKVPMYFVCYQGVPPACWQSIFLTFINSLVMGICFFLSLYFAHQLNLNMSIIGLLMSCYGTGTILGGIVSGKLSDIFPPLRIVKLSILLQSMSFFLLTIFVKPVYLGIILFLLGFSGCGFKTANQVSMLQACQENKQLALKVTNIAYTVLNLGLGVSGMMIGIFSENDYKIILYFFSGVLVLIFYLIRRSYLVNYPIKNDICFGANPSDKPRGLSSKLIFILIIVFWMGLVFAQFSSTYPVYVEKAFPVLGTKAVSTLFALNTFLIVLGQMPLSRFCEKFNAMLVMGCGGLLMGVGMLVLSVSPLFLFGVISCVLWTFGEMLFVPTAQALCFENSHQVQKGQNIGLFQSTYALSTVLGPALGGYIFDKLNGQILWYISFLMGGSCFVCCLAYSRVKHHLDIKRHPVIEVCKKSHDPKKYFVRNPI